MTDFLYDVSVIDPNFSGNRLENYLGTSFKDECDVELSVNGVGNHQNDVYDFSNSDRGSLLNTGVHSVFNEIAHIKPTTSSSSSEEDDKNFIMSWELNEHNFDTLPNSPVCFIKQEAKDEDEHDITDDNVQINDLSSELSAAVTNGFIETPPVSPEITPVSVNGSTPVNILLIDSVPSTVPSATIYPLSSANCNGRRLVPVTPLRSQARKNCVIKVPLQNDKIGISNPEIDTEKVCDKGRANIKKIPSSITLPPADADIKNNLLVGTGKPVSFLSVNQVKAIKRQQRMIKNRESASLSRKKKKEYVSALESKLDELTKENALLKTENKTLKDKLSLYESSIWKKHGKLFDNTKKVTAVFAVMFMISFNVASLRNFPSSEREKTPANDMMFGIRKDSTHFNSRSLLWTEQTLDNMTNNDFSGWTNTSDLKCPMYINQTESLRLDKELRKWIDTYPADNTTNGTSKFSNDSKLTPWPVIFPPFKKEKKNTLDKRYHGSGEIARNANRDVEMFNIFDVNEPLYQAMDRKQDTFYVVSFSGDHLLLPAISHNQTLRPKMSLVLPSLTNTSSFLSPDTITMMQIDCTVTDTRLFHMKEKDIPPHLKNHLKNPQKSNLSYTKQALRRKFNSAYP